MLHLYLPGFSQKNKKEQNSNSDFLSTNGISTTKFEWDHWRDENETFNPDEYVRRLKNLIKNKEFGIISKSIGTFISAKLLVESLLQPKYWLIMGLPLKDLSEKELENYKLAIEKLKDRTRIKIIQNLNDTHGNFSEISDFLIDFPLEIDEKDRGDHLYYFPHDILEFVRE